MDFFYQTFNSDKQKKQRHEKLAQQKLCAIKTVKLHVYLWIVKF